MANITYLIGAGASIDSIPIVDNIESAINSLIKDKLSPIVKYAPNKQLPETKKLEQAIIDLRELSKGCGNHRSIDTFMKKLYLKANTKDEIVHYKKMKSAIILFFELYRFYATTFDKRYDGFLATILNKTIPPLPNNINVLSWNYDYEFERAYTKYDTTNRHINELHEDLNIIHKNSNHEKSLTSNFGILKINGTAGFYKSDGSLILGLNCTNNVGSKSNNVDPKAKLEELKPIIYNYDNFVYHSPDEYTPAISFAWDEDYGLRKVKDCIKEAMWNTEILIIIGYSFPYFNREIDKYIMSQYINSEGKNVYVQDPRANELIETVRDLKHWGSGPFSTKLIPKTDTNQFFMSF